IRKLHRRHPDLLESEPELRDSINDAHSVTYTQWEIYLAFHHQRHKLVFEALPETPRSPLCVPTHRDQISQGLHRWRPARAGAHRGHFADQGALARKTMRSFLEWGADPTVDAADPTAAAIESAQAQSENIVQELANAIRHPDPREIGVVDDANVASFLA